MSSGEPRRRRRREGYFPRLPDAPAPLSLVVPARVALSEADALGIAWHGEYPRFFERAGSELTRQVGLTYDDYRREGLLAPIVRLHVEYLQPLLLDMPFTIRATMVWTAAARLDTEYELRRDDGQVAATGCTVQIFTTAATGEALWLPPPLWQRCLDRWQKGEFACLQNG